MWSAGGRRPSHLLDCQNLGCKFLLQKKLREKSMKIFSGIKNYHIP